MSLLQDLRRFVPNRRLTITEAYVLAERQATELLRRQGACAAPVTSSLITGLPFLTVSVRVPMRSSGATQWIKPRWIVLLNGAESPARQRFSLAHELKHVLDHPRIKAFGGPKTPTERRRTEQLCDYFAACLLMPRAWVKSAFYSGVQDVVELADLFQVSPPAMQVRLTQLGILDPYARCSGMDNAYLRQSSASSLGLAA